MCPVRVKSCLWRGCKSNKSMSNLCTLVCLYIVYLWEFFFGHSCDISSLLCVLFRILRSTASAASAHFSMQPHSRNNNTVSVDALRILAHFPRAIFQPQFLSVSPLNNSFILSPLQTVFLFFFSFFSLSPLCFCCSPWVEPSET